MMQLISKSNATRLKARIPRKRVLEARTGAHTELSQTRVSWGRHPTRDFTDWQRTRRAYLPRSKCRWYTPWVCRLRPCTRRRRLRETSPRRRVRRNRHTWLRMRGRQMFEGQRNRGEPGTRGRQRVGRKARRHKPTPECFRDRDRRTHGALTDVGLLATRRHPTRDFTDWQRTRRAYLARSKCRWYTAWVRRLRPCTRRRRLRETSPRRRVRRNRHTCLLGLRGRHTIEGQRSHGEPGM